MSNIYIVYVVYIVSLDASLLYSGEDKDLEIQRTVAEIGELNRQLATLAHNGRLS
jgi:hypothetical protein